MRFNVTKTYDYKYEELRDINSLDELMEFVKRNGSVIVSLEPDFTGDNAKLSLLRTVPCLEIYDTWRE